MKTTEPNYLNVDKNRWRVDKWAAIKAFVQPFRRPKDALVLYLAGPDDLDRHVACQLGFRSRNLIAANQDEGICKTIRRAGNPVLCGRFERLLEAIPMDLSLDVIDADMCCGLDLTIAEIIAAITDYSLLKSTPGRMTVSFNLQRGRDASSNQERLERGEFLREVGLQKHRGLLAYALMHETLFENFKPDPRWRPLRPWFSSYRSNRVTMDSVVFAWHWQIRMTAEEKRTLATLRQSRSRERRLWAARKAVITRAARRDE